MLAIGILALSWVALSLFPEHRSTLTMEASIERQRAQLRENPPVATSEVLLTEPLEPALRVAGQLNARWDQIFAELANARIDGVAVLEIVADAGRGTLRMVGHARSLERAFDYLELLQTGGVLHEIAVESHEWTVVSNMDVVRFTLSARWSGAQ